MARAVRRFAGVNEVVAELPIDDGPVLLSVTGDGLDYELAVNEVPLAKLDGRGLSTSLAGGFTGTMLGPYVHAPDAPGGHNDLDAAKAPIAYWDWFDLQDLGVTVHRG